MRINLKTKNATSKLPDLNNLSHNKLIQLLRNLSSETLDFRNEFFENV